MNYDILRLIKSINVSNMYRQNAYNMSYIIINDRRKFLAWDPTKQINYGRHASKMAVGTLIFTIALSNFISLAGLKHVPVSVLGTYPNL